MVRRGKVGVTVEVRGSGEGNSWDVRRAEPKKVMVAAKERGESRARPHTVKRG